MTGAVGAFDLPLASGGDWVAPLSAWLPDWLPVLAPAWPLALALLLPIGALGRPVLWLARWAALPGLLVALLLPAVALPLPGVLLGAMLVLDDPGRPVLAAVSLLWLAGGWIAGERLRTPGIALAFLLGMTGALWLPLAGDLASLLAASTLAAYPLYGLLGGNRGGRVLLATVVVADLAVLELLLILAEHGAALDFPSLRGVLATSGGTGLAALVPIAFGAKAGVVGLHYWLAPAAAGGRAHAMGPLIAFALAASLLPLLRLLPLGDAQWPAFGAALQVAAAIGGLWALVAGLLQAAPRAVAAYAWMGLTGVVLGVLGAVLAQPDAAGAVLATLPTALALAGLGAGALLCVGGPPAGGAVRGAGAGRLAVASLAALAVALAATGAAVLVVPLSGVSWGIAVALGCALALLGAAVGAMGGPAPEVREPAEPAPGGALAAAAALPVAGFALAVVPVFELHALSTPARALDGQAVLVAAALLVGGLLAGALTLRLARPLPRIPPGDLLLPLERLLWWAVDLWRGFGETLGHLRDRAYAALASARTALARRDPTADTEALLGRWPTALLLMLATAVAAALLAGLG